MPDSERMKSSSALWQRLSMSSGLNGLRLRNHLAAGSSPFFPEVHEELTKSCRTPTRLASVLLLQLLSHPLTTLKKKDTSTCLLWMSLWPHISARPQLSDGRRGRAIRPSCAEPHLHSFAPHSGASEIILNSQAERGWARVSLQLDHPASSLFWVQKRHGIG